MLSVLGTPWFFGIVVSVVVLLIVAIFKGAEFSASKKGFALGGKHENCFPKKDIPDLMHKALDHITLESKATKELVEQQMRYYEEIEIQVIGLFQKLYLTILIEKLRDASSAYAQHPEYVFYSMTIKTILAEVKVYLKSCFQNNHFAEKTIEEQQLYVEKKISFVSQKITDLLNLHWRGDVVKRVDLYQVNTRHKREFEDYLEDVLNRAFLLSRETDEKIKESRNNFNKYIESITKGNND